MATAKKKEKKFIDMSGVEIDNGVPIPAGAGTRSKYPWADMEAGQSFFIPGISAVQARGVYGSGRGWCVRNNANLKCVHKAEEGGYRFWLDYVSAPAVEASGDE
jgi:hypothetical protein